MSQMIRISANEYVHIKDLNENIAKLIVGSQLLVLKDHERVINGPVKMVHIPPWNYCVIWNPAVRDDKGEVIMTSFGEPKVKFGEIEIRTHEQWSEPFPLQIYEILEQDNQPYWTIPHDSALRIECIRHFIDPKTKEERFPGDEWLIYGPGTFIPRIEERVVAVEKSVIIKQNHALQVRARKNFIDWNGNPRVAGETWNITKTGSYFLDVYEEHVTILKAFILTDQKAIHLRATATYKDVYGIERKNGQEWLVTIKNAETHILDVNEALVKEVEFTVLSSR